MALGNVFYSLADAFVKAGTSNARRVWDGVGTTLAEQLGCAVTCTNSLVEAVLPSDVMFGGPLWSLLQGLRCRRDDIYLLKSSDIARKGTGFSYGLPSYLCI